jgi:hypothetical protein
MECPLCNGLCVLEESCTSCGALLSDMGKVMDYEDDYSAYLDIDTQKQNDGDRTSFEKGLCYHLFFCRKCGMDLTAAIEEVEGS